MPTYCYSCQACDHYFENVSLIADRLTPTTSKCPICKKKKVELVPAAPTIGDPIKLGVTKLPGWWQNRLQEMKGKHRGSTIRTDSTLTR